MNNTSNTYNTNKYIGFIGLDLDGTVFNDNKEITPLTLKAIKDAEEKGLLVSPVTGRPMNGVPDEFVKELKSKYVIAANGAAIYKRLKDIEEAEEYRANGHFVMDFGENNLYANIYEDTMEDEKVIEILTTLEAFDMVPDCFVNGSGHMPLYAKEMIPKLGLAKSMENYILSRREYFPDLKEYVKNETTKVEKITINFYLNDEGKKEKERAYNALKKIEGIALVSGAPHNLEVNCDTVGKGNAILTLCEILGIDKKKTCACGDDINDLDMIEKTEFSVAMGNAVPLIKERASFTTLSNEEDGVAVAIDKFISRL
ncbi:MAG: HAD-IIB family hydrolase [Lachnospiraceae bacterium]|nr:HAD-IIB family hydrolase [Lachnospiraceae bacterium]